MLKGSTLSLQLVMNFSPMSNGGGGGRYPGNLTLVKLFTTLVAKNFGRVYFRPKFCPKIKTSEIFGVRILKASEFFNSHIFLVFQFLIVENNEKAFSFSILAFRNLTGN